MSKGESFAVLLHHEQYGYGLTFDGVDGLSVVFVDVDTGQTCETDDLDEWSEVESS